MGWRIANIEEVIYVYPNLLGQKAYKKMTDADMARVIGVSRTAYQSKAKTGRFTPAECRAFCIYFGKSFDFLFAENDEAGAN